MFVSLLLLILYIVMLNLFYQNKSVIHQYNERNFTLSLSPQATTKQNKGEEIRHAYTNYPHIKKKKNTKALYLYNKALSICENKGGYRFINYYILRHYG